MILTDVQAKGILKSPKNKIAIEAVKLHESALRIFTEELDEIELKQEPYWTKMQDTLKGRINKKYNRVIQFARYPLPVTEITDSILGDYYKVFDGKNRYFNVDGDRDLNRLKKWIQSKDVEQWIEDKAKSVFKNKPCTFVVIDKTNNGDPYFFEVCSDRLIDAEFKKGTEGELEYIAFLHSVEPHPEKSGTQIRRYGVYDDKTFWVFRKDSDESDFIFESGNLHNVGYCPAVAFVSECSNSKNPFKRRVAFGPSISKLEDWTNFDIFRNYVDHYAPFPVTEGVNAKCPNPSCNDGMIEETETIVEGTNKGQERIKRTKCPVCDGSNGNQYIGPGTHIGLKYQMSKDIEDGSGKFQMIFPDVDKLKYTPEKLDDLELEVRYKTVGINEMMSNEAFNELQVKGSFASMDTILLRTKIILDKLYKFIVMTGGKMMYQNLTVNVEANHGTEWYLVSEDDLQKRYDTAKRIGLPKSEQLLIYLQLIDTKYKGNKKKIERSKMLLDLDPFPLYSEKEVKELYDDGVADGVDYYGKINFLKNISKFEHENAPLTEFGLNLEYQERISKIVETLNKYNNEKISSIQLRERNPASENV